MSVAKATKGGDKNEPETGERIDRAPPDEDLAEVLADMPQDATVAVRRVGGGKQEFVANMDAVSLTEEYAAANFGPGHYRCKYAWADEHGRKAYRTHKTITISEDAAQRYGFYGKRRDRDEESGARGGGTTDGNIVAAGVASLLSANAEAMRATQRGDDGESKTFLITLMEQNAANHRAMLDAQAKSAERTTTLITTLVTALTPLLTALITRKPDDPLALATKMAEVMKSAAPPAGGGGMKDALEALGLVLDMKERLTGEGEADDVPTALIKNFAGPFGRLVEAYAQRGEGAASPTPSSEPPVKVVEAAPAPARIAAPAAAPATPPQTDGDMMIGQFKAALRGWVQLAQQKKNPLTYAQVTWDEFTSLPKPLRDIAIGFLAETVDGTPDGDFALEATAAKWVPEVAQYPEWFREFFDELRELAGIIEPEDADEDIVGRVPATPPTTAGGK